MDCLCFRIVVLLLLACGAIASGCRREAADKKGDGVSSAINVSSKVAAPPEKPSEDLLAANKMLHLLDDGDRAGALAMARSLMDSPEQKVRLVVIDMMGWMGKVTLPELVELMEHKDEVTAEAALP